MIHVTCPAPQVQARDLSLAEVKASAEVLRQAHSQMQVRRGGQEGRSPLPDDYGDCCTSVPLNSSHAQFPPCPKGPAEQSSSDPHSPLACCLCTSSGPAERQLTPLMYVHLLTLTLCLLPCSFSSHSPQAQLSASNSELEGRAGELARMLESATREAAEARALAGGSQEALREAQAQAGIVTSDCISRYLFSEMPGIAAWCVQSPMYALPTSVINR
jgi:hypothetical protein